MAWQALKASEMTTNTFITNQIFFILCSPSEIELMINYYPNLELFYNGSCGCGLMSNP